MEQDRRLLNDLTDLDSDTQSYKVAMMTKAFVNNEDTADRIRLILKYTDDYSKERLEELILDSQAKYKDGKSVSSFKLRVLPSTARDEKSGLKRMIKDYLSADSIKRLSGAIVDYERSLITPENSDRYMRNIFSRAERLRAPSPEEMRAKKRNKYSSSMKNKLNTANVTNLRSYLKKYGKRTSNSAMPDEENARQLRQVDEMNANALRAAIMDSMMEDPELNTANVNNLISRRSNRFTRRRPNNSGISRNFTRVFNKPKAKRSWWPWGSAKVSPAGGTRKL
jgi:hypothetical protein